MKMDFSHDECNILENTWTTEDEELYEIGAKIYRLLFSLSPELKKVFPYANQSNYEHTVGFRIQAMRFVGIISKGVGAVVSRDSVRKTDFLRSLEVLGKYHQKFSSRGFKIDHFDAFKRAMSDAVEDRLKTITMTPETRKKAIELWKRLMVLIITKMRIGYSPQNNADFGHHYSRNEKN